MIRRTRADLAIRWIEAFCTVPSGPGRGRYVRLTDGQCETMKRLYDGGGEVVVPVAGPLGAFICLLHLVGIEHDNPVPPVSVDVFTLWAAAGPKTAPLLATRGHDYRLSRIEHALRREGGMTHPNTRPFSLSDDQLQLIMTAATSLESEKRAVFLERIAALLKRAAGPKPDDHQVNVAVRAAMHQLMQAVDETSAPGV